MCGRVVCGHHALRHDMFARTGMFAGAAAVHAGVAGVRWSVGTARQLDGRVGSLGGRGRRRMTARLQSFGEQW